jgi:hypothetical protein
MTLKNASAAGQAINLAAFDARKEDRENDVRYIYQRYVYWTAICDAIQGADIEMIQEVINNSSFDELIKQLKEKLK